MTPYITTNQAATALGIHPSLVRAYCQSGRLPATKLGGRWLIRTDDLAKLERRVYKKKENAMGTTFLVNEVEHNLVMLDENGIDWSADFIGNTSHGMAHDEEGNYIATQEELAWWQDTIAAHLEMQALIRVYNERYGEDEVSSWLEKMHAFDVDLEDQPASVKEALEMLDD